MKREGKKIQTPPIVTFGTRGPRCCLSIQLPRSNVAFLLVHTEIQYSNVKYNKLYIVVCFVG